MIEQRAARYLQSALHRRHKSDATGEQLSMEEVVAEVRKLRDTMAQLNAANIAL